jgi:uncharacterized protein YqcC (DUF446 family)
MWPFKPKEPAAAKQISYEAVAAALAAIEEELRRTRIADVGAPTPEALAGAGAFGQPTLAFEQWLVHVFVPRVRSIIAARGAFPPASHVGDQAFREWRRWGDVPDVDPLIERLRAFDALFD